MHNALVTNGRLVGESVLIQGASSGVGLMGMQIANTGPHPLATNDAARSRRADLAIDTSPADRSTCDRRQGCPSDHRSGLGSVANANMKAARVLGRIVNVGRLGGAKGEFDYTAAGASHIG